MLPARKKVARAELERVRLAVVFAVLDLAARTRAAYYTLAGAAQVAAVQALIVDAGEASMDLATRQHEAGNTSDLDLASERASFEAARVALMQSQLEEANAREELAKLLGVFDFRIASRLPDLPSDEPPLDRLESLAVAQRADLAAARKQVETLNYAASLARASRWTGFIDVGADVARLKDGTVVVGPRASLELPIFDQRQATVARLDALVRAAELTERAIAIDVRSSVRAARAHVVAQRKLTERYRTVVVPTRESVVRLSQERYDSMLMSVFQLLQAKQAEVAAYREYVEAVRDYWIARSDLERAVGARLPGAR
jgi:cobalt-zinc-cadmium efflux system outer membrane protein